MLVKWLAGSAGVGHLGLLGLKLKNFEGLLKSWLSTLGKFVTRGFAWCALKGFDTLLFKQRF